MEKESVFFGYSRYSLTVHSVRLLLSSPVQNLRLSLDGVPRTGEQTADGILYQNLFPGLYTCTVTGTTDARQAVEGDATGLALLSSVEPTVCSGALLIADITVSGCVNDGAVITVDGAAVEQKPVNGVVTLPQVAVGSTIIGGGFEYDGKELAPLDTEAAKAFFADMKAKGVKSIAISCVFSTVRNDHEVEAAKLCREIMGEDVHISISSEIGSMGLIERENATILNAALWQVAERFTEGFAKSLRDEGIVNADVYLSQNDGTLMTMEHARRYPILTVACGPTNSIRGASYLSSLKDAIVVDVGGTTTDLGVIQNGFPRESSVAVTIGGVRTNFRMPDVISIGLGGGSIVRVRDDGSVTVGPDSVGYEITKKALVFGGDVMTATDIAVRLDMVELGDKSKVEVISQEVADKAMAAIRALVEDSVDAMKVSNADVDLILVGGGSIILPEKINGAASVLKPEHFGCANAIGSAISKVSGTYEKLMNYDELPREQSLEKAKKEAVELAVEAGAVRDTVEIIEMEDVPLAYYPGNTNRVKIKAAGDLS